MNEDPGENFLARWSRRKRQIQSDGDVAGADVATLPKDSAAGKDLKAENGKPGSPQSDQVVGDGNLAGEANPADAEHREPAGESAPGRDFSDIDFDKLNFESDYTTFMEKDVPDDVRNLALRKLWASNPVLTFMDGLDDYCEDYTDAAVCMPVGTMKTAYKFGRGFLNDEEVAEWEALGKPEEPTADEQPDAIDDEQAPIDAQPKSDPVVADAEAGAANEAASDTGNVGDAKAAASSSLQEVVGDHSEPAVPVSTADARDNTSVAGKA